MIFTELVLENFGAYAKRNVINLSSQGEDTSQENEDIVPTSI